MKLIKSPAFIWDNILHLKYEEFVTSLINTKNLNLNFQNELGETPLHICCKNGYLDKFYTLIYMGADFKIKTLKGENILHYAAFYSKDLILTQEIAKNYINPLEKNNNGQNAINICTNPQDVVFFENWAQLNKIILPLNNFSDNSQSNLSNTNKQVNKNVGDIGQALDSNIIEIAATQAINSRFNLSAAI